MCAPLSRLPYNLISIASCSTCWLGPASPPIAWSPWSSWTSGRNPPYQTKVNPWYSYLVTGQKTLCTWLMILVIWSLKFRFLFIKSSCQVSRGGAKKFGRQFFYTFLFFYKCRSFLNKHFCLPPIFYPTEFFLTPFRLLYDIPIIIFLTPKVDHCLCPCRLMSDFKLVSC